MKILTVRSFLPDMGPGTQPLTIAKNMRELGHETVFATSGGAYTPEVIAAGFPVELIAGLAPDKHNPLSIAGALFALRRLIARTRPDVIHGHNAAATVCAYLAGLSLGRHIPCATSVRGVEERTTHQWRNGIWKRTPGVLLAVCEKARERLSAFGCPADKIVVTYNGIDLTRFDPANQDRESVREELSFSNRTVIAVTGAMTGPEHLAGPGKGQHILVEAASRLRQEFPELLVFLIGDGPGRAKVEAIVDRLDMRDHVVFAGRRFDIPRLLAGVDIYALPSIHGEFFPNSIIEAMAMELPWVGSDIAGLSELTAHGEAGWVTPPDDIEALASNLGRLLASAELRRERGLRGRREVEERFTIQRVTGRILAGYAAAGAAPAATA